MDDNKKIKSRLFIILLLTLFLTVFSLFQVLIYPSLARYIKQERDEIYATYNLVGNGYVSPKSPFEYAENYIYGYRVS